MGLFDESREEWVVTLPAIAREVEKSVRVTQVMLQDGTIKARKVGFTWVTTRGAIAAAKLRLKEVAKEVA